MPPNSIVIPRKEPAPAKQPQKTESINIYVGLAWAVASTVVVASLVATRTWARRWLYSGAAIESLLIIYGSVTGLRIFLSVPIWILIPFLNLIYTLASSSYILHGCFVAICYSSILVTCIIQFKYASALTRRTLRSVLVPLHFTGDKIALFNLPGLKIDVGVDGLIVVRGLTISLLNLTVQAHSIELGFQLKDNTELALYVDEIEIQLLRGVHIGELYGALRSGKLRTESVEDGSTSAKAAVQEVMVSGDAEAEIHYNQMRQDISASSRVSTSREEAKSAYSGSNSVSDKEMRAAICVTLQNVSSVPHAPSRLIRMSTLLNLIPSWLRRFLGRLPLLLRVLLMPLSCLHPLNVTSISASVAGRWLTPKLQNSSLEYYAEHDPEIKQLRDKVYHWLAHANFCFDFTELDGLSQVPLRKAINIVAWLRCGDMTAFRVSETDGIETAVQLGGADATFVIPSYLLPHHEHIVPASGTEGGKDGGKDEAEIKMAIHGSFPACINQTLLDFACILTKASKVFEMEAEQQNTGSNEGAQSTGRKLAGSAKHPHQNLKAVVKKVMASGVVDDQWIAELMGKLAAQLESMQGEVGYSGGISVAIGPYRGRADLPSKLLA